MKLGVLNTSILTTAGIYKLEDISLDLAKKLVSENEIDSAVDLLSAALGTGVAAPRIQLNLLLF